MFIAFVSGIVLWTFLEYVLHRFLGHEHRGRNFFKDEHILHHQKVHYFAPAFKKATAAIAFSIIVVVLLSFALIWELALGSVAGLVGMYGLYEITHMRFHKKGPIARPFIVLRKHHFYHHFHQPSKNYGVTTRFWDRVFGTFQQVEMVSVPRKMTMDWLMKGSEIAPAYAKHFQLR